MRYHFARWLPPAGWTAQPGHTSLVHLKKLDSRRDLTAAIAATDQWYLFQLSVRFSTRDKHPEGASIFVYSLQTFIRKFGFQNQLNLFQRRAEMNDKVVKAAQRVVCWALLIGPFIAPLFTFPASRTKYSRSLHYGSPHCGFCPMQQRPPTFCLEEIKKKSCSFLISILSTIKSLWGSLPSFHSSCELLFLLNATLCTVLEVKMLNAVRNTRNWSWCKDG